MVRELQAARQGGKHAVCLLGVPTFVFPIVALSRSSQASPNDFVSFRHNFRTIGDYGCHKRILPIQQITSAPRYPSSIFLAVFRRLARKCCRVRMPLVGHLTDLRTAAAFQCLHIAHPRASFAAHCASAECPVEPGDGSHWQALVLNPYCVPGRASYRAYLRSILPGYSGLVLQSDIRSDLPPSCPRSPRCRDASSPACPVSYPSCWYRTRL